MVSVEAQEPARSNLANTVLKAFDALECLADANTPLTAQQVGLALGMSRTTTYRLLMTLASRGYVVSTSRGQFRLGPELLRLSQRLLEHLDLPEIARPDLLRAGELSNETCYLALLDGTSVLYVDLAESKQAVRLRATTGTRGPLHCTSLGKAVLAFLPEDEQLSLIDTLDLFPRTPNTITTKTALLENLRDIRARGYSIDEIENEEGVRCVGAPILNHLGRPIAAMSIAGPAYRVTQEHVPALAEIAMRATQSISRKIGYQPDGIQNNHDARQHAPANHASAG
jgi:DNA-binding IclR family transcriptional regulator